MSEVTQPTLERTLERMQLELASHLQADLGDFEAFEDNLHALLMNLGRLTSKTMLESMCRREPIEDEHGNWTIAVWSNLTLQTSFGKVTVRRPRYRRARNQPTRCPLSEAVGVIRRRWTPRAARVAGLALAELSLRRSYELLSELGGGSGSQAALQRLGVHLSDLWEERRREFEQTLMKEGSVPKQAAAAAISLDGVMLTLVGNDRAEQKAKAQAAGKSGKGVYGYKEASVGVVTFYDKRGKRIETRRYARMPESNKVATKDWLARYCAHLRGIRPGLTIVGIADGAPNNWSFLGELGVDVEVVDYYHAASHVHRIVQQCSESPNAVKTLARSKRLTTTLLEKSDGAKKVFTELRRLRRQAGQAPKKGAKTFFDLHKARMSYVSLRARNLPIGSGVTESTCRYVVVDRLRRTGMRWGLEGGQAILTLRSLKLSGEYERGFRLMRQAEADRTRRAA